MSSRDRAAVTARAKQLAADEGYEWMALSAGERAQYRLHARSDWRYWAGVVPLGPPVDAGRQ
ncbi:hypothetical protein AB4Z55_27075 [Gordonia sp. ABKF26]|uniref:hypothetical protein n=1 Tax=Gordonia sp. ABKF26 TaxID=3238687 RepID=UPI0034E46712